MKTFNICPIFWYIFLSTSRDNIYFSKTCHSLTNFLIFLYSTQPDFNYYTLRFSSLSIFLHFISVLLLTYIYTTTSITFTIHPRSVHLLQGRENHCPFIGLFLRTCTTLICNLLLIKLKYTISFQSLDMQD